MASTTVSTSDICRFRGDDYSFTITIKDSAGDAVDITGFSFLLTIDPSSAPTSDTNNLDQLTGTITDATGGQVRFDPTATSVGTVGNYFYDVQQTDAGGKVRTILTGKWDVEQDVTK